MGAEDYLFLPTVRKVASSHSNTHLFIIEDCGHVVNVEQPALFNRMVIGYLEGMESRAV
jgi:pimeloyl-ACP methyl ester carboxylesterase